MSTLVAHAGNSSYYTPLASNPCSRYQTRSNSTNLATHAYTKSEHQRKISKYGGVSLPLDNVDARGAHIGTPLSVEEEMKHEPVETIPSTGTAADLLRDNIQPQSLDSATFPSSRFHEKQSRSMMS